MLSAAQGSPHGVEDAARALGRVPAGGHRRSRLLHRLDGGDDDADGAQVQRLSVIIYWVFFSM